MPQLPPLASLRAFEAAARLSSFKRAAAEIGVTPTAVSHQVRLLEGFLGTRLFDRHPGKVVLTVSGLRLSSTLSDAFRNIEEAVRREKADKARRVVTLSATNVFTGKWLVPRLELFNDRNPDLVLRLHSSVEAVDLRGGLADCAVRYGAAPFSGLTAEALFTDRFCPMCSPRLGVNSIQDLSRQQFLRSEWRLNNALTPTWEKWLALAGASGIATDAELVFTDENHTIQAAVAGLGVALLSPLLVGMELEKGLLVQPFTWELPGPSYYFVQPEGTPITPEVQAVRDWLFSELPLTPERAAV